MAGFKCPVSKPQAFLWDSTALGLGLRATPAGKPVYVFQRDCQAKTLRQTIGRIEARILEQAGVTFDAAAPAGLRAVA